MRQRFFATFTIASVVPFSGQHAPLVQAVSISTQNQNTMVTSMNDIDESIQSFAHLQTSEGIGESEQQAGNDHLTTFGQSASDLSEYADDAEYRRLLVSKHLLNR